MSQVGRGGEAPGSQDAGVDEPRRVRVPVAAGVGLSVRVRNATSVDRKPPFVLLHGIASTAVGWDGVAIRLASAGRESYALDFRGHGESDRPDEGYDLATFASDVIAALDGLGLERAILAGHSLGANVILEAVGRRPGIAAGVGLVEGGLVDARDQFGSLHECLAGTALPRVAGMPLPRLQGYLRQSNPGWSPLRLAAAIAAFDVNADGTVSWRLTESRHEALVRELWAARAADRWPALGSGPEAGASTVVVAADTGDESWTEAKRSAEAAMRGAVQGVRIEWLTADHDVHSDRPDEVAALLLEAFGGA